MDHIFSVVKFFLFIFPLSENQFLFSKQIFYVKFLPTHFISLIFVVEFVFRRFFSLKINSRDTNNYLIQIQIQSLFAMQ